jgi:hypothetical protein
MVSSANPADTDIHVLWKCNVPKRGWRNVGGICIGLEGVGAPRREPL